MAQKDHARGVCKNAVAFSNNMVDHVIDIAPRPINDFLDGSSPFPTKHHLIATPLQCPKPRVVLAVLP
jgi:hypothetical protein